MNALYSYFFLTIDRLMVHNVQLELACCTLGTL